MAKALSNPRAMGGLLGAVVVYACTLLAPSVARADYVSDHGYACRVTYTPAAPVSGVIIYPSLYPTLGDHGGVSVSIYSGPHCSGTFVRHLRAYSAGSNVESFTGVATVYGEMPLLFLWESLQRAADAGERIRFTGQSYNAGSFSTFTQLRTIRFGDYE